MINDVCSVQSTVLFYGLYFLTSFKVECKVFLDTVKIVLLCFENNINSNMNVNRTVILNLVKVDDKQSIILDRKVIDDQYNHTSNDVFVCNLVVCVVPSHRIHFGNYNGKVHLNITLTRNNLILNNHKERV